MNKRNLVIRYYVLLLMAISCYQALGTTTGGANCGDTIAINVTASFRLGKNATMKNNENDNGFCNVTLVSDGNITIDIVDFLYYTPMSQVHIDNTLDASCLQKFISISRDSKTCKTMIFGKSLVLNVYNANLEIVVGRSGKATCLPGSYNYNCLAAGYDSVLEVSLVSRKIYVLNNLFDIHVYDTKFKCPEYCVCKLGKNQITEQCTDETYVYLVIYNKYVKEMSFSSSGIRVISTTAFENLHGLKFLLLDHNGIRNLQPGVLNEALIGLKNLYLQGNFIRVLPENLFQSLNNVSQLYHLDISDNLLQDVPLLLFNELHFLRLLNLSSNNINSIRKGVFDTQYAMNWLYLSHNKIKQLPGKLFYFTTLEWLYLDHNLIEYLPRDIFASDVLLGHYLYLHLIDLSYNRLKSLPNGIFDQLKFLYYLRLFNNNFKSINESLFRNNSRISTLALNNNKLEILSINVFEFSRPYLSTLDIGYNLLRYLPNGVFDSLSSLINLNIENNRLTSLPQNVFKHLNYLTILSLNANFISQLPYEIFGYLNDLKFLFLANNDIFQLDNHVFRYLGNLIVLELSHNHITEMINIDLDNLVSLDFLSLASNNISSLPRLNNLLSMTILDISDNNLPNLSSTVFRGLSSLNFLNVSYNDLQDLPHDVLSYLPNLILLDLSYNQLNAIHKHSFRNQSDLVTLNLAGNSLKNLDSSLFHNQKHLLQLDLQGNAISSFENTQFINTMNLQFLNLSRNCLQTIEIGTFNFAIKSLETVDLRHNTLLYLTKDSFAGVSDTVNFLVDRFASCCFMNYSSCVSTASRPIYLTCKRMLDQYLLRISIWVLGLSALLSNFIVLCFRCSEKDGNKVQMLLISNLSMSDMLMGINMVILAGADTYYTEYFPSYAYTWRSGYLCKLAGILSILSSETSVLFITLISIDRFLAVKNTFSSRRLNSKSAVVCAILVWSISLMLSVIPTVFSSSYPNVYEISEVCVGIPIVKRPVETLTKDQVEVGFTDFDFDYTFASIVGFEDYLIDMSLIRTEDIESISFLRSSIIGYKIATYFSISLFIIFNFLCFFCVAYCYIGIFLIAKASAKAASRTQGLQNELRMAMKISAVVLTDFICWVPLITVCILAQFDVIEVSAELYTWTVAFILPINSSINPFLYTLASVISNKYGQMSKGK